MVRKPGMLFTVLTILAAATGGVMSLNVTCDLTMQALLTLVQHQMRTLEQHASTIHTLQTQLSSLKSSSHQHSNQIGTLRAKVNDVKKGVTARLDAFNAQLERKSQIGKVAFTAHMSAIGVNVGNNGPFIFDQVITNVGNSYNSQSGIFVAPYDGVYVFYFIMVNAGNAPTIHAQIQQNAIALGAGTSDGLGESNKWDDGSALATAYLKKGDHVYVKRRDGGTKVYGGVFTSFSGFLLDADA